MLQWSTEQAMLLKFPKNLLFLCPQVLTWSLISIISPGVSYNLSAFQNTLVNYRFSYHQLQLLWYFKYHKKTKVCDKDIKEHRALKLGEQNFIRSIFHHFTGRHKTKEKMSFLEHWTMQIILSEFCLFSLVFCSLLILWHSLGLNHLTKLAHQNFKKIFLNYFSKHCPHLMYVKAWKELLGGFFTNYLYEADESYCEVLNTCPKC